eukprot:CAMPEP_0196579234 /NCGR_PEP_ID=MMETSP1081-20130531/19606_1 /TAXON_ID=36882 /ORGANISM="Pyramimonas amylifera, Strain CCMP720" /LENGTH=250 /DNA_ID=CAMNT_0041898751 /DNA_START=48 /DNA_END=800 /DNA_ORIENTATION=+
MASSMSARFSSLSFKANVSKTPEIQRANHFPAPCARQQLCIQAADLDVKNVDGSSKGSVTLNVKTAGENSLGLIHKYLITTQTNKRRGTASTLTRAEVRGGGRKPMKQKGAGAARQGSRRTPLKPGGGVVFGPKPKDWSIDMNKKERRLAMSSALDNAASSSVVIEDLDGKFEEKKTKTLVSALEKWGVSPDANAVLCVKEITESLSCSARNIAKVKLCTLDTLTIYDVLRADKLVFDESSISKINEVYA